jgi:hypothetical protein
MTTSVGLLGEISHQDLLACITLQELCRWSYEHDVAFKSFSIAVQWRVVS